MSRFVIVNVPPVQAAVISGPAPDASQQDALDGGCAWLIRVSPGVDDVEEALRAAVREYFASEEGRRVREAEGMEQVRWCDALSWIPDELWQAHGITVFHHPEAERIILDGEEDLAEELAGMEMAVAAAAPPDAASR